MNEQEGVGTLGSHHKLAMRQDLRSTVSSRRHCRIRSEAMAGDCLISRLPLQSNPRVTYPSGRVKLSCCPSPPVHVTFRKLVFLPSSALTTSNFPRSVPSGLHRPKFTEADFSTTSFQGKSTIPVSSSSRTALLAKSPNGIWVIAFRVSSVDP